MLLILSSFSEISTTFFFYFTSTNLLLILYYPSTNWLPYLDKQEALGSQYIPRVGMLCSQAGNTIFPVWEHFFRLIEILNLFHLKDSTTPSSYLYMIGIWLVDNW